MFVVSIGISQPELNIIMTTDIYWMFTHFPIIFQGAVHVLIHLIMNIITLRGLMHGDLCHAKLDGGVKLQP